MFTMKKKFFPSLILIVSITIFSCSKEKSIDTLGVNNNSNNTPTSLIGDWRFLNLYMDVSSTATGSFSGVSVKAITSYKTTSIKNTGTLSFATDIFKAVNMGYSIDDTVHVVSYTGPIKDFEQDIPFDFEIPSYNGTGKYKQIGSDSLYFPDGSVFQGLEIDGQQITSSEASGTKYAIKSDTLLVYANVNVSKDTTIKQNGMSIKYRVDQKATTIGTFKKK